MQDALFTLAQLADPDIAEADKILRACVHCGFCTATCPTYVLLGDELDSPRGRIYLIKDMLENDRPATAEVVKHIDRCLSCLACMTTCPSGVHYMHLVDHARAHIEETYPRPLARPAAPRDAGARAAAHPPLFRRALGAGAARQAVRAARSRRLGLAPLAAMLRLAPARLPATTPAQGRRRFSRGQGPRRGRVALLDGCVEPVLAPAINAAAIRLLTRHGIEVVRGRRRRAAAARSSTTWAASRRRWPPPAARSTPGSPRSRARGSTPSWSRPRAAAPRSRTTASCCAPIAAYADKAARVARLARTSASI